MLTKFQNLWVSSEDIAWCIHFVDLIIEVEVVAWTEIGRYLLNTRKTSIWLETSYA